MTDEIDSDANSTHELTAEVARARLATDHGGVLHRRESGGSALCPGGYRGIL